MLAADQDLTHLPLPPISFDPQTFTSFGPPPADRNLKDRSSTISSFIGSVFSSFTESFRSSPKTNQPTQPQNSLPVAPVATTPTPTLRQRGASRIFPTAASSSSSVAITRSPSPTSVREARSPSYRDQISSLFPRQSQQTGAIIGLNAIWANDDTCFHCYECSVRFTTFNRRHHCRFCGRIFCDSCSRFRIPGQPFGVEDLAKFVTEKRCVFCWNYATTIAEDVLEKLATLYLAVGGTGPTEFAAVPQVPSPSIATSVGLVVQSMPTSPLQLAPSRSRTSSTVISTQDSDVITSKQLHNRRQSGSVVVQTEHEGHRETLLPKTLAPPPPTPISLRGMSFSSSPSQPIFEPSSLTSLKPSNFISNKAAGQQITSDIDNSILSSLAQIFAIDERQSSIIASVYRQSDVEESLRRLYKTHLTRLCTHFLTVEQLDVEKWQKSIIQMVYQTIRNVKPQPRAYPDTLDLRRCVKIKKIYDPSLSAHFEYVDGLVFTKSLSHRLMLSSMHNPRILLIQSGLDFERDSQQQLSTLDVVVNQEAEQMFRTVSQIATAKPTILFCGGSIPTLAVKELIANEIASASFVKPNIMEQIARFTGASILSSVDSLSLMNPSQASALVGSCRTLACFSVHKHTKLQKTFICLSGCEPLGCTLVLRDRSYSDLKKIKAILQKLLSVARDGQVLCQYLTAFRADPFSLDSFSKTNVEENDGGVLEEDSFEAGNSTQRNMLLASRRSFSGARDSVTFNLVQQIRHRRRLSALSSLPVETQFSSAKDRRASSSHVEIAFALANSGLLAISPLIRLPDPSKKASVFDSSPSRQYFESPLYSLLGASFLQGNQNPESEKQQLEPPQVKTIATEKALHPFCTTPLTGGYNSEQLEKLMFEFRRNGSLFEIKDVDSKRKPESPGFEKSSRMSRAIWAKPLSFAECQALQVLVSTFSFDSQNTPCDFCYGPALQTWPFYSSPDHSLGEFLNEFCFKPGLACPRSGCGASNYDHIRRFASNSGRVDVIVRAISQPIVEPGDKNDGNFLMWALCKKCNAVTPIVQADEAILYEISFACYLHRKFDGVDFATVPLATGTKKCPHAFERNYIQFFAKQNRVAAVKYSSIDVYDIVIPKISVQTIPVANSLCQKLTAQTPDGANFSKLSNSYFEAVGNYLETLRINIQVLLGSKPRKAFLEKLLALENMIATERKQFAERVSQLELLFSSQVGVTDERDSLALFESLSQSWIDWNNKLKQFVRYIRSEAVAPHSDLSSLEAISASVFEQHMSNPIRLPQSKSVSSHPYSVSTPNNSPTQSVVAGSDLSNASEMFTVLGAPAPPPAVIESPPSNSQIPLPSPALKPSFGRSLLDFFSDAEMFSHPLFKTKLKLPLEQPFANGHHYLFKNQKLIYPVGVYEEEPSSLIAFFLSSEEYQVKLAEFMSGTPTAANREFFDNRSSVDGAFENAGRKPLRSVALASEIVPVNEEQHDSLNAPGESETQSLNSYSIIDNSEKNNVVENSASESTPHALQRSPSYRPSTASGARKVEANRGKFERRHITVEWFDVTLEKDVPTKFTVTAYHAAAFAEIRTFMLPSANESRNDLSFVQALCRSKSWQAAGGKSGVKYFKTLDRRFVLKQVQKPELQTIFDMIPAYLEHIKSSKEHKRPSALVPILGAYTVALENGVTGKSFKYDLIAMKYLFRSYVISEKFDLKGSKRNRLVKDVNPSPMIKTPTEVSMEFQDSATSSEGQQPQEIEHQDIVLLDENLLIRSLQDPLYVYPHSKKLLLQAIAADTHFLASNSVMDYSLLVGLDSQGKAIVVGIIDYLRTYTWDKRVESAVKASGLLGGQGLPTIVEPGTYRNRFLTAMRQFFHEVPDHWLAYEVHNLARR